MSHGINCDCDECFRINANEEFGTIQCEYCNKSFESVVDFGRHWNKLHKEEYYKSFVGGGSILDINETGEE